ncbi:MAG TPA: hypothetical protein VFL13_06250 [Candidatus Baltobacteraceae bacterium]|nr:hypothetical protein [Candidatus Baltobacteraceae bacterium]
MLEIHRGYATICQADKQQFPASYLVADLGKPGVPKLSPRELYTIRKIEPNVGINGLRFEHAGRHFIVFVAGLGPCHTFVPGYPVLDAEPCWFNMPVDGVHAMPCRDKRASWMSDLKIVRAF